MYGMANAARTISNASLSVSGSVALASQPFLPLLPNFATRQCFDLLAAKFGAFSLAGRVSLGPAGRPSATPLAMVEGTSPKKKKKSSKGAGGGGSGSRKASDARPEEPGPSRPRAVSLASLEPARPVEPTAQEKAAAAQAAWEEAGMQRQEGPSADEWELQLRAERAEALCVQLRAEADLRSVEALAAKREVQAADDLTACCEGVLRQQQAALLELQAQLATERRDHAEARERGVLLERQCEESKMVMAHHEQEVQVVRDAASLAQQKYREQAANWKRGADKIRDERADDAKGKVARLRVWEAKIARWLDEGYHKKLDALVYAENKRLYDSLALMLRDEYACLDASQRAWDETVEREKGQELAAATSELRETQALLREMKTHRTDLERETAKIVQGFYNAEMADVSTTLKSVSQQLSNERGAAKGHWDTYAEHAKRRRAEARKQNDAVVARLQTIENEMRAVVLQREMLAHNDPRALLQAERKKNDDLCAALADARAERDTAKGRMEHETAKRMDVQQALQRRDDEIASRKLEFGEKEHLHLTLQAERSKASVASQRLGETQGGFEARLDEERQRMGQLEEDRLGIKDQAKQMAASLAHYATLEAQWVEESDGMKAALAKVKGELAPLRRKARRVDELEAVLTAWDVEAQKETLRRVTQKVAQLEKELKIRERDYQRVVRAEGEKKAQIQHAADEARSQQHARSWEVQNEQEAREEVLLGQILKLKEGIAAKVLSQFAAGAKMRSWKSWCTYVLKRKHQRLATPEAELSGDEGPQDGLIKSMGKAFGGLF